MAKTIDLCNNPMTKEPKLDRARRQVPEWTQYDNKIASLAERVRRASEGEAFDYSGYLDPIATTNPIGGVQSGGKDEL